MKYAVIDVLVTDECKIARNRFDKHGEGMTLDEACELMRFIVIQNPETHYPYLVSM